MNQAEYHKFYQYEDHYWWFTGMRRILVNVIEPFIAEGTDTLRYLDVGCGTGGGIRYFEEKFGERSRKPDIYGIDMHPLAVDYCRKRQLPRIVQAIGMAIPFRDESFDLVGCYDVLQHIEDDESAMGEMHRVCRKGGKLLVKEAAFDLLMDENSVAAHVVRRYTRGELRRKMEAAGFRILRATYVNSILFIPVAVDRILKRMFCGARSREESATCLKPYSRLLNTVLYNILAVESNLLRWINFPAGVSVIVVGEKV